MISLFFSLSTLDYIFFSVPFFVALVSDSHHLFFLSDCHTVHVSDTFLLVFITFLLFLLFFCHPHFTEEFVFLFLFPTLLLSLSFVVISKFSCISVLGLYCIIVFSCFPSLQPPSYTLLFLFSISFSLSIPSFIPSDLPSRNSHSHSLSPSLSSRLR